TQDSESDLRSRSTGESKKPTTGTASAVAARLLSRSATLAKKARRERSLELFIAMVLPLPLRNKVGRETWSAARSSRRPRRLRPDRTLACRLRFRANRELPVRDGRQLRSSAGPGH